MKLRYWTVAILICVSVVLLLRFTGKEIDSVTEEKEPVALALPRVEANQLSGEVLFICDAVIDNRTGSQLTVKSHFYSAFDGLELVVMDEAGRELAQQSYLRHQSLCSLKPRSFPLREGRNEEDLRFPVPGLPPNQKVYRVRLVGSLPGSDYAGSLGSNEVVVAVE